VGARGPIPKREDQRRRRNKKTSTAKKTTQARRKTSAATSPSKRSAARVAIPKADPGWHAAAKRWYDSLAKSGQSSFYQPSDWAMAWLIAESISRDLKPQVVGVNEETGEPVFAIIPLKGASLAAYLKAMTALLATEGDRRRVGLELERAGFGADDRPTVSEVPRLDDYRDRLSG
jgi:hypothetical protein